MYLDHFGLSRFPFTIAPDPDFLFPSVGHQEALAHLQYALTGHGGLICLTGEVGTGKTTLCRAFLATRISHIKTAYIFNPQLSALELLQSLCDELGIAYDADDSQKTLYNTLNHALLAWYAEGTRVICVIDEAQSMPAPLLEQVRLLTNLETNKEKLLTLILVGQPELREILARHELRQLSQRITARYHLSHLSELETRAYLKHRLMTAGCTESVFDSAAARVIWRGSGGVPRIINSVADRALLGVYASNETQASAGVAKQALKEVTGGVTPPSNHATSAVHAKTENRSVFGVLFGAVVGLLLVVTGFLAVQKQDALLAVWHSRHTAIAVTDRGVDAASVDSTDDESTPIAELPVAPKSDGPERVLAQVLGIPDGSCAALIPSGWKCSWVTWSRQQLVDAGTPMAVKDKSSGLWRGLVSAQSLGDLTNTRSRALIGWQPPAGYSGGVRPGRSSPVVRWVRQQLGMDWHGNWTVISPAGQAPAQRPNDTFYDPLLKNRVMQFQVQHGLDADGILGPQTLVFLQRFPVSSVTSNAPTLSEEQ